jgi:hypothetical protein
MIFIALAAVLAQATDAMPVARLNELVQRYCAVCHTDAARNGGLSLQHFDAVLTSQSAGSDRWTVTRGEDGQTTAAILAQTRHPDGTPSLWSLVVSCSGMQLSWFPAPKNGTLTVSVDGNAPALVPVEGSEKMGNGTSATTGPAVGDLFPGQTVGFPFGSLNSRDREELSACTARHIAVP